MQEELAEGNSEINDTVREQIERQVEQPCDDIFHEDLCKVFCAIPTGMEDSTMVASASTCDSGFGELEVKSAFP